jgi:ferredoxin-NADP reductase
MAIVKKYPAKVLALEKKAGGVYSVELQTEGKPFQYYPGQFLHLALDEYDPAVAWPESRCFSIQTPPGNDTLRITFSVKGSFTARMESELISGKQVTLKLPYGELFTQEHSHINTAFVSGGTGITPFLSLFNDSSFSTYSNPVLFAGFRKKELNFYQRELHKALQINPAFRTMCFFENEQGLIDPVEITRTHPEAVFISGPPAMIRFYKNILLECGIDQKNIKTDDWE